MIPRFTLGRVCITRGALNAIEKYGVNACDLLTRHITGDWGDIPPEDWHANDAALSHGSRLLSAYPISEHERVWVITEADRSVTTLLLPEEY